MVDLHVRGGTIVDVAAKRCYAGDVLVNDGLIHSIAPPSSQVSAAATLDAAGQFVIPGLIDPHLHIESSLLNPLEFAQAAVEHGTTAVFVDPHEIANVAGRAGIELFLRHAEAAPLDIFIGVPSCVPATDFEDSGAALGLADVADLLRHPRVYGLAEMMNFPGVIYDLGEARAKVDCAYDLGKVVDGHAPGVFGDDLRLYVTNGRDDGTVRIMSDHESRTGPEALEKRAADMTVAVRYGSAAKDLDAILPYLIERGVSLEGFMLCSDDLDAHELHTEGHVDRSVRRARDILLQCAGMDAQQAAIQALALATLHPARYVARYFRQQGAPGMGEIGPGKAANLAVVDSLAELRCTTVIRRGEIVVANGKAQRRETPGDYGRLLHTVSLDRPLQPSDFTAPANGRETTAAVRVIGAQDGSLTTRNEVISLPVRAGEICADVEQDVVKIAVIERHHATGTRSVGFVSGLGLQRGAVASTVGHDSHNLIVAGVAAEDMAAAANQAAAIGGGMAVVVDGEVTALQLALGGLMSTEPIESVVGDYAALLAAAQRTGTTSKNIFLLLSFLALPVIPQLKITNRGLVDVDAFAPTPLLVD